VVDLLTMTTALSATLASVNPSAMAGEMGSRLALVVPEMILVVGTVFVVILGLSRRRNWRDLTPLVTVVTLALAMIAVPLVHSPERATSVGLLLPMLGLPVRVLICATAIALCLLTIGLIDRRLEQAFAGGRAAFDPIRVNRGEFYAFFLLSVTGVMLVCTASDLIWLFLALELTSLPTYVMVAMSRSSRKAQEAAVKYFFLGALATAIFLYGFALIYGAAGSLVLTEIADVFADEAASGGLSSLAIIGVVLAILGIGFKIAAAPLHFYVPDVYEGAASSVTAFLAFIPKAAGMLALMLVLATVGWSGHSVLVDMDGVVRPVEGLPQPILVVLWMVAVLTMTLGNIGALLQRSVKRMLAYSSVAHSGYMVIGLIAGPALGLNAVLVYLLAYGVMNTAAFAVLAGLERDGEEIETLDDLSGLRQRHPFMAIAMALAAGSLIGLPPLLGFWGKLYLFIAGIEAGHLLLVIVAAVNSAISAWYYLLLVKRPVLAPPTPQAENVVRGPSAWPRIAAFALAIGVVIVPVLLAPILAAAGRATDGYIAATPEAETVDLAVDDRAAGAEIEAPDVADRRSFTN